MKKLIAMGVMAGALVVPAGAQADQPRRYCGTTADGFPGVLAAGPTTCGFARNVAEASERKRVPLVEWRPNIWMPRPKWVRAWSPKMRRAYRMHCRTRSGPSPFVSCTGGKGARVDLVS